MRRISWRRLTLAMMAAIPLVLACGGEDGGGDAGSPEDAIRAQLDMTDKGQWAREWAELHPAHQALVPRDLFVTCAEKSDVPSIESVKVLETYQEQVTIPGTTLVVDSVAVTVELELSQGILKANRKDTFHVVPVNGRWRWVLKDPEAYKGGVCPP